MRRRGSASVVDRKVLARRLESCQSRYSLIDDIVDHLRDVYPDYRRMQQKPFYRVVQQTIDSQASSSRKMERVDKSEARLQNMEGSHLRKRRMDISPMTSESSSSKSSSSDEEEDAGAVSTSDDGIYSEKVEPEFDLTKSILRATYGGLKKADSKVEEKSMEIEIGTREAEKIASLSTGETSGELKKDDRSLVSNGDTSVGEVWKESLTFKDLGGMRQLLENLKREILVPFFHPHLLSWLGLKATTGILLHGPPGCGKTRLAQAIANETGVPFYKISATEVVSGVSGQSEENIRELFAKAYRTAPSIVFIDEIDAIASNRENAQKEMERRIVTQLMTCMDESHRSLKQGDKALSGDSSVACPSHVLVIGSTNRPDALDPALRRPGRFDYEIALGVPDVNARAEILKVLTRHLKLEASFDCMNIAKLTPGFVGADLEALVKKAGNLAINRALDQRDNERPKELIDDDQDFESWKQPWTPEQLQNLWITVADFEAAAKMVQPSLKREGFATTPDVKWEDVGGLDHLRNEFERYILRCIKFPEAYVDYGMPLENGFLLYGPPGCGKTLIAKALATEAGANFIHIKGPELLNKYVGESEREVRKVFARARSCQPCIIFFDEVDALTKERGTDGGWVVERVINQLLIELDGADNRRGVYVIGATNRPLEIDRALLRPGRFSKLLFVPLPGPEQRGMILKALARGRLIDSTVDLSAIGRMEACEKFSGADLSALMHEASMLAFEESLVSSTNGAAADKALRPVKTTHFEQALRNIKPSVSDERIRYYLEVSKTIAAG